MIIRPKSTSDLSLLQRQHEPGENEHPRLDVPIQLFVEQDLEGKIPTTDIQDDKDFEVWFDGLQDDLEAANTARYTLPLFVHFNNRTYRAVLQTKLHSCNTILSQTSALLSTLNTLKLGFSTVADQTSSFQSQCDTLVQEEEQLSRYADKLAENLQPFESLEPISRQLNAPGADFVTKPDFIESLKRVDQGLTYFKQNVLSARPTDIVRFQRCRVI